jgi:4-hydroxy-tetrahydrodipicolinate reductase
VHLSGPEEELVLTHRALDRSVFARGALLAGAFAADAAPGRYGMKDVLG